MLIKDLFTRYQIFPTGILHVGAHEGQEGVIYDAAGIRNIVWVEGNPDMYKKLCINRPGDINILALVSDIDGEEVEFKISNNEGQSSSILDFGTHTIQHPSVKFIDSKKLRTTTIHRLSQVFPSVFPTLDFLAMDIQGMELRALKGMSTLLGQFQWIYLEVNRQEVYKECALVQEVDQYLDQFGFTRVETKWVGGWGDGFYVRKS